MFHRIFEKILIIWSFALARYLRFFVSREHLEAWQRRRLKKLIVFLKLKSPFYRERLMQPWNVTPPTNAETMTASFDQINTRGIIKEQALSIALRSEQFRDLPPMIDDIAVGVSMAAKTQDRALICGDLHERANYVGTLLAKTLPPGGLFAKYQIAVFTGANESLLQTFNFLGVKISPFDLSKPFAIHVYDLQKLNPTLLVGSTAVLKALADEILKANLHLTRLIRIFSVSEGLAPAEQAYIERAFSMKIDRVYICPEGIVATTCEEGSFHLNEDLMIVEREWIDQKSGRFRPIVTDLHRRTQPIFRYKLPATMTEDPESCDCGSVMIRIKMTEQILPEVKSHPLKHSARKTGPPNLDFLST